MYSFLFVTGTVLLFLGIILIFLYSVLNTTAKQNSNTQFGGVIMVGPIPIIFGNSGPATSIAIALGIILFIIAIVFFFFAKK
ncbi:MAG: DUF131 domain-containing protein [Candidatus Marsarchaeota archaeon]|nr:DUF131 domain-containing protein [Candidatus Marsarchaeota archaeon]MCL5106110.1 DUF131 domain-containing protein [Candidatus Marsarchaeota archaeon]